MGGPKGPKGARGRVKVSRELSHPTLTLPPIKGVGTYLERIFIHPVRYFTMKFAAKVSEIPDWGKKLVTVDGRDILLVKVKGAVFAMDPECPHQGAPLSGALIKDA